MRQLHVDELTRCEVGFVELCERFAYYGTTAVMINFIQQPLPDGSRTGNDPTPNGQPGALDYGQRAATGASLFNRFWVSLMEYICCYTVQMLTRNSTYASGALSACFPPAHWALALCFLLARTISRRTPI